MHLCRLSTQLQLQPQLVSIVDGSQGAFQKQEEEEEEQEEKEEEKQDDDGKKDGRRQKKCQGLDSKKDQQC